VARAGDGNRAPPAGTDCGDRRVELRGDAAQDTERKNHETGAQGGHSGSRSRRYHDHLRRGIGRGGPAGLETDEGGNCTLMATLKAFRVFDDRGTISGRVVETSLQELSPGDVVVKAAYSSVNYKDALAATGKGKIIRRFPLVGGIDASGTVMSTTDARFK